MEIIINFKHLLSIFGEDCLFYGNKDLIFNKIQSIYESDEGNITWVKPGVKDEETLINETKATCILCNEDSFKKYKGDLNSKLFAINDNPKLLYLKINKYIMDLNHPNQDRTLIHPTAQIHPSCKIGKNVQIGAFSHIGECEIGDGTVIYSNVNICSQVYIGKNCLIREYCSIGGQGFGFYRDSNALNYSHIPHIGNVIIEDNVHLFPYVNVDLGTIGSTTIGYNTLVDHYSHIGHNCKIGNSNIIAAKTVLSGGVKIGNNNFIGVGTLVKEKCIIGSNVIIGIGSVVLKDIPNNEMWFGNPAQKKKNIDNEFRLFGL